MHHDDSAGVGTIGALVQRLDADRPTIVAVDGTAWSAASLRADVAQIRDLLHSLGIGADACIAIVVPNGPLAALAFIGVASVAVSAPLNPTTPAGELHRLLDDLCAAAVVVPGDATPSTAELVARERGLPVIGVAVDGGRLAIAADNIGSGPVVDLPTPRPPTPGDVALVLHTSGTTSRPKLVPLTHANLMASAAAISTTLRLEPSDRCCNVMPLFHIHGLVAALLASLHAGGSVITTPGFFAPDVAGWIDRGAATWFTAVPTMHQALIERFRQDPASRPATQLRFVRSSSASLPPVVLEGMEAALGCPLVEAYGMTEAAHQMACNPLPPGERRPGAVGPAAGPELAIMDGDGRLLPTGEIGEVVIRGANVTSGYLHNPEANAGAFTDGWFRTGDQGRLDTDGYLWLTGRLKELINRGGEKISPREVDEALLAHPAVQQAVTFAVPDARLGEQVAAAVVLRPGADASERELRELVGERLAPHKVPRRVVLVGSIPLGPSGKLQRIGLSDVLGLTDLDGTPSGQGTSDGDPTSATATAPRDSVERLVADLWQDVLGVRTVGVFDHFLDLGGDSMLAARLLARLTTELELEISVLDLFDRPTVAGQAALVADLLAAEVG
jgi:oxalate---CoA ligase